MRGWCKVAVLKALSLLPFGERVHFLLQRTAGELRDVSRSPQFRQACFFLGRVRAHAGCVPQQRVVELGTGWVPVVPLAHALCGARVDAFDVHRLVRSRVFREVVQTLPRWAERFAEAAGVPLELVHSRLEEIRTASDLAEALERLSGSYYAPWDTRRLPYDDAQVDVVVSNLVLQCVPEDQLLPLLEETNRVLKPGGLALHRVNLTCEYFSDDPRRHPLHLLQFDDATWNRWFNHRLKHLNRLRRAEFLRLFERAGFSVVEERVRRDEHAAERLKQTELAERFRRFDWTELSTTGFEIVLRKPAASASGRRATTTGRKRNAVEPCLSTR